MTDNHTLFIYEEQYNSDDYLGLNRVLSVYTVMKGPLYWFNTLSWGNLSRVPLTMLILFLTYFIHKILCGSGGALKVWGNNPDDVTAMSSRLSQVVLEMLLLSFTT